MTRLRKLVKQAKVAMENRGHKCGRVQYALLKDQNGHPLGARIRCIGCHKPVFVTVYPTANEIDVGGEGVALNCDFFGSISTDTVNPIHLIRAFLPWADKLFTGKTDLDELYRIRERVERGYPAYSADPSEADDRSYEDLDFLIDGLNTCAPRDMYFGAHPDDGANYGFWKIPT